MSGVEAPLVNILTRGRGLELNYNIVLTSRPSILWHGSSDNLHFYTFSSLAKVAWNQSVGMRPNSLN